MKEGGFREEIAFGADDVIRTAMAIVVSELNGAKFDFEAMRFRDQT